MNNYFNACESIYEKEADDIKQTIKTIALRYVGQNPAHPAVYRAFNKNGVKRKSDYSYHFDFNSIFPSANREEIVYAWAKLWSDQPLNANLSASAYGPATVFVNGQIVFKTNIINERYPDFKSKFKVSLNKGWNSFVLKFVKTEGGFGGLLGPDSPKSLPVHFIIPSKERDGQEGWLYTKPLAEEMATFPLLGMPEVETGFAWYPAPKWNEKEMNLGQLERVYGISKNCYAVGWTKACFYKTGVNEYKLKGRNQGSIEIYLNENLIYHSKISGNFIQTILAPYGKQDIFVKCDCEEKSWGYNVSFSSSETEIILSSPYVVKGSKESWFYIGPLKESKDFDIVRMKDMRSLVEGENGSVYWRLDMPETWIRPYNENSNFGKWNYPLGVTLYGLISAGRMLEQGDLIQYVKQHVEECTTNYFYGVWDKQQYGAPGVLNLLTNIDCLDDCGSFGFMMLELSNSVEVKYHKELASSIAEYIRNCQSRLEDGAFYRNSPSNSLMNGTLWADDLYMSVPFLCRYYKLTGEHFYIDDAAKQLLLFYKYLFIEDKKIMSHVYDLKHNTATRVPWGRGNGWVAFSFSELLEVLPEGHGDRPELLRIFNQLCEGYLGLQDEEGMWHQVLTDPESYSETSCTSMFSYAFARGVRFGWLQNADRYVTAALKAWKGLCGISIDQQGNIYGVCRGSGFSFTADYYKNELSWNLNDTHGTGIVLLAGVEVIKLMAHCAIQSTVCFEPNKLA